MDSAKRSCGGRATLRACRPGAQRPCSRWSARRARLACNGIPCQAVGPIGIRCAPPDAARNGRALWKAAPRWRKGGRHSGGMLWGMGQMGPVLVSVSFTLNSVIKRVTKPPSVNPVRGCVILTQWLVHQRRCEAPCWYDRQVHVPPSVCGSCGLSKSGVRRRGASYEYVPRCTCPYAT